MIGKPIRHRSPVHLDFVRRLRCLGCRSMPPSNAHHLTIAQPKARGLKSGDQFALPLCDACHRSLHDRGDEEAWWAAKGIDPMEIAREVWVDSPGFLPDDTHAPLKRRKLKTFVVRNRRA